MTLSSTLRAMEERSLISREEPIVITATAHSEEIFIGAIVTEICKEKHELDKKYPHVCFWCKDKLIFKEMYKVNKERIYEIHTKYGISLAKYLKKLWKCRIVEFYCCNCYRDKEFIELFDMEVVELG